MLSSLVDINGQLALEELHARRRIVLVNRMLNHEINVLTLQKELDDMLVRRRNIHYCITPQVEDAPMVGAAIAAML